jgi:hypothetical protein
MEAIHHAYLLVGDREGGERFLRDFWEDRGVRLAGSPDYFVFIEPTFGIDEARKLSAQAIGRAFTKKKIFFIAPDSITIEAQNALLKTFEEPVQNTHFFLLVRDEGAVLPTLKSRCQILNVKHPMFDKDARNFLKLSIKDRLSFIRKFVENEENLSKFLDELLFITRSRKAYEMRLLSSDRGASPRLILEHLALVL